MYMYMYMCTIEAEGEGVCQWVHNMMYMYMYIRVQMYVHVEVLRATHYYFAHVCTFSDYCVALIAMLSSDAFELTCGIQCELELQNV